MRVLPRCAALRPALRPTLALALRAALHSAFRPAFRPAIDSFDDRGSATLDSLSVGAAGLGLGDGGCEDEADEREARTSDKGSSWMLDHESLLRG
ncbi:MAG: hypothetical protein ACO4CW_09750 [Planctomycetota bacterium]